jgi:hypothetical protein
MSHRASKWALAIAISATITLQASGQAAVSQQPQQFSSSLDQPQPASTTASKIEIPGATWVQLSITDWSYLQKAAPGSKIPLVVTRDVVVNGVTAIPAGTTLTGLISNQKNGTHWLDSDGKIDIEAADLTPNQPVLVYRRSVLQALHGPKPSPDPEDSHALKVVAISTAVGLGLGLLGNDQQTGSSRGLNGAIGAGVGLVIGTIIEAGHQQSGLFVPIPGLFRPHLRVPTGLPVPFR